MATAVGPWQGSTPQARIECDYTVTRNADATAATVTGTMILATSAAISDSTNTWEVWGGAGSASGSNVSMVSSGAGRFGFCNIAAAIGSGGMDVGGRVRNLEGPGATIEAVLHLDGVTLAPYSDGNYYATNVTATSFKTANHIVNPNGGTMVDLQAQINTSQSEVGAWLAQSGTLADVTVGGLTRATTYYFRTRVANNTYGWGPWGPWKSVTTLKTAPSTPTGYSATDVSQTSAKTTGISVSDNGGQALSDIRAELNKYGYPEVTTITRGSWGDITFNDLDPGTKYQFRLAAYNGVGWSAYGAWAEFDTLPGVLVKYGGVWRNAIPYVKVAGVWKQATRYVKVSGVWR